MLLALDPRFRAVVILEKAPVNICPPPQSRLQADAPSRSARTPLLITAISPLSIFTSLLAGARKD